MAAKSLGVLVNETVTFGKKHLMALLVGAVVFGFLTQGVSWWFVGSTTGMWPGGIPGVTEQMNDASARLQVLMQKAQTGQLSADEQKEMEVLGQQAVANAMQSVNMMGTWFRAMLPAFGAAFLLSMLIGLLAKSYFVVLAVKGMTDPGAAVQTTLAKIVPLIGLWLWLFIRTFIWIPIIGVIIAIIIGPRFILSPLYLLEQGKGVMESTSTSMRHTSGYWGKIIGNALVVGIVAGICGIILSKIVTGVLGMMIGGFVAAMIMQFVAGFMAVFMIILGRTVMQAGAR